MGAVQQWLSALPPWVLLLVIFLVVLAEDAIFVGFFIPGETVLLIGGALASFGNVPVGAVFVTGACAAVIGDSIGFEVGRHLGPKLRTARVGRFVKESHWTRADVFMHRNGGHAVFLGRWVSYGRALVPALSGATKMHYRRFLRWNAIGGVLWAAVITTLGFIGGASWQKLGHTFGQAVLLVVLAGALVVGAVLGLRWLRNRERVTKP